MKSPWKKARSDQKARSCQGPKWPSLGLSQRRSRSQRCAARRHRHRARRTRRCRRQGLLQLDLRLPSGFSCVETSPSMTHFFRDGSQTPMTFGRASGVDPLVSRRIYSEGDFLPGLIVDRYGEYLVVQSLTQAADRLQPLFTSILQERYQPRSIVFRNDSKVRELEGLPLVQSWIGEEPPETSLSMKTESRSRLLSRPARRPAAISTSATITARRAAMRAGRLSMDSAMAAGSRFSWPRSATASRPWISSAAAVQLARSNAERNGLKNISASKPMSSTFCGSDSARASATTRSFWILRHLPKTRKAWRAPSAATRKSTTGRCAC